MKRVKDSAGPELPTADTRRIRHATGLDIFSYGGGGVFLKTKVILWGIYGQALQSVTWGWVGR